MTIKALFLAFLKSPLAAKLGGQLASLVLSGNAKKAFVGQILQSIVRIGKVLGRVVVVFEQVKEELPDATKVAVVSLYHDVVDELEQMKDLCQEFEKDTGVDKQALDEAIRLAASRLTAALHEKPGPGEPDGQGARLPPPPTSAPPGRPAGIVPAEPVRDLAREDWTPPARAT